MTNFDQKTFDELMLELKNTRKRHEDEIAAIQAKITKLLFP